MRKEAVPRDSVTSRFDNHGGKCLSPSFQHSGQSFPLDSLVSFLRSRRKAASPHIQVGVCVGVYVDPCVNPSLTVTGKTRRYTQKSQH